jgi:hypothetical protein
MRALLPEINALAAAYGGGSGGSGGGGGVRFLFVYILEAHAADEWPIQELPPGQEIYQHRGPGDRLRAARRFLSLHPLHAGIALSVDNAMDDFVHLYASWPFRCWVLQGGTVRLKSMPVGDSVSLDALRQWLADYARLGYARLG